MEKFEVSTFTSFVKLLKDWGAKEHYPNYSNTPSIVPVTSSPLSGLLETLNADLQRVGATILELNRQIAEKNAEIARLKCEMYSKEVGKLIGLGV